MTIFSKESKTITVYSFSSTDQSLVGSFEYFHAEGTSLAANSTDVKPPALKTGFIPVFNEKTQKWLQVRDLRGQKVYSTSDQGISVIDYTGPIKDGFTEIAPGSAFETWTGEGWADLRTDLEKEATRLASFKPLTRRQFRMVLVINNYNLADIEVKINEIEDPVKRQITLIEWEDSTTFERGNESLCLIAQLLKLTNDQFDTLWEEALIL